MSKWADFIDKTDKKAPYILYTLSKILWFNNTQSNKRALSLGIGAGNAEVELLNMGWSLIGIDIEPHAETVIRKRLTDEAQCRFKFYHTAIEDMTVRGKYNYIIAFNALPFISRNKLIDTLNKLASVAKANTVLAINLFGTSHSFTKGKNAKCFSVTKKYILSKLSKWKIIYCEQRIFDRPDGAHWDTIDIIAMY